MPKKHKVERYDMKYSHRPIEFYADPKRGQQYKYLPVVKIQCRIIRELDSMEVVVELRNSKHFPKNHYMRVMKSKLIKT